MLREELGVRKVVRRLGTPMWRAKYTHASLFVQSVQLYPLRSVALCKHNFRGTPLDYAQNKVCGLSCV